MPASGLDDALANWTQTAGFTAEFCSLGGTIAKRVWVPRATQDYDKAVAAIPRKGVDGVFAATGDQTVLALYRANNSIGRYLITGTQDGGIALPASSTRLKSG